MFPWPIPPPSYPDDHFLSFFPSLLSQLMDLTLPDSCLPFLFSSLALTLMLRLPQLMKKQEKFHKLLQNLYTYVHPCSHTLNLSSILMVEAPKLLMKANFSSQCLWLAGRYCSQNSALLTSVLPSLLPDLSHQPTNNYSLILKIIPPLPLLSPLILPYFFLFLYNKLKKTVKTV